MDHRGSNGVIGILQSIVVPDKLRGKMRDKEEEEEEEEEERHFVAFLRSSTMNLTWLFAFQLIFVCSYGHDD